VVALIIEGGWGAWEGGPRSRWNDMRPGTKMALFRPTRKRRSRIVARTRKTTDDIGAKVVLNTE